MQAAHTSSRPLSPGPKLAVGALVVVGALVALAALGNLTQVLIALLVIGVILIVVGCLALPFLLVGLAVYGLTRLVPTGRHARFGPRPVVTPAGGVPAAPAPAAAVQPRAPDLPPDLAAQVARIQEKAAALRSPEQQPYVHVEDRQRVEETLDEHLPRILATYRAFPRGSDSWTVESEGATVKELLARQLTVLEEGLDEIARRVFRAGADDLVAQQRFLQERFQQPPPGDLQL